MEPISTIASALGLARNASELGKKVLEVGKGLKDSKQKQQLDEIAEELRDLKQAASDIEDKIRDLEDENRNLREKLRFKSDEYEFRSPFRYHKDRPNQPLCVTCFSKGVEAQMGEPGHGCTPHYRMCLVCGDAVQIRDIGPSQSNYSATIRQRMMRSR